MEAAGIEFLGRAETASDGNVWSHFRGPDGNVYEIMSGPSPTAETARLALQLESVAPSEQKSRYTQREEVWMSSKRQTTMAKLTRERKVKEKRELKLEKKAAAKAARAEAPEAPEEPSLDQDVPEAD